MDRDRRRLAAARTLASGSTYLPSGPLLSRRSTSRLERGVGGDANGFQRADAIGGLVARHVRGSERQASAILTSASVSLANTLRKIGTISSLGRPSSCAAFRRTAAEGADRESEASAGESARRTSLSLAGSSSLPCAVVAAPVSASLSAPLSVLMSRCLCASKRSLPSSSACSAGSARASPRLAALTIAAETSLASVLARPGKVLAQLVGAGALGQREQREQRRRSAERAAATSRS